MDTYEKKYKEALEKATIYYKQGTTDMKLMMKTCFPELAESEDEKIRKSLLEYLHTLPNHYAHSGVCALEWLAWLEKQGEQKPTDVRTWKYIVDAVLTEREGIGNYLDSPWTTEVAEKLQKRFGSIEQKPVEPQQDMLSQEQYAKAVDECIYGEKPAWSEEDEIMHNDCICAINAASEVDYSVKEKEKLTNWLKSLKDRVQPQNKWKESLATADLENSLCDIQDGFSDTSYEYRILGEAIEFIRCTEPKPHWKPSDEQMKALEFYIDNDTVDKDGVYGSVIVKLYEQLKSLK